MKIRVGIRKKKGKKHGEKGMNTPEHRWSTLEHGYALKDTFSKRQT
jgi:hypothetical protein